MTTPVRLQLSRRRGFDLQAHSRAVNGLAAVSVARPTRWGNPFKPGPAEDQGGVRIPAVTAKDATAIFRQAMEHTLDWSPSTRAELETLRGRNLACWCKPGDPCHADVPLELANKEPGQ